MMYGALDLPIMNVRLSFKARMHASMLLPVGVEVHQQADHRHVGEKS